MDRNSILRTIMLIIVIGCFGYLVYYYFAVNGSQKQADNLTELKYSQTAKETKIVYQTKPGSVVKSKEDYVIQKYKPLYLKNKNLIGWIKIDDTNIDYPIMKSVNGNGEFYLDHDYGGNEDRNGTLFMDDDCDPFLPSINLIVYGHNMKSGQMFGELDNYKSQDFYAKHPYVMFDTIYREGIYDVAFAFQSHVYEETEIAFKYYQFIEPNSEAEFDSGIAEMRNASLYDTGVDVVYGDELLTLSTCDYDEENGRFVVVCRRRR